MTEAPPNLSAVMRWIAQRPHTRQKPKFCDYCGKPFTTRGRGLYCSAACRAKAYRQRKAGAAPANTNAAPGEEGEEGSAGQGGTSPPSQPRPATENIQALVR